ncbi:hypothetical protein [Streptomyces chryseus]
MRRRPAAEPVELARMRGFLRAAKGSLTYESIAQWVVRAGGKRVSASTLCRAMDGRLPTKEVFLAFACGAAHAHARGASAQKVWAAEEKAAQVWEAAFAAVHPPPADRTRAAYGPGRVTTLTDLVAAMRTLRTAAGNPSLRSLVAAADGRFSRGALHNALTGRRLPSEELLKAFVSACGADQAAEKALLAARQILSGPRPKPAPRSPCDMVDQDPEHDAHGRRWRWLSPELDWYEQQLRDAEKADRSRFEAAWEDGLTDEELGQQQEPYQAAGRDLRAELAKYAARAQAETEA